MRLSCCTPVREPKPLAALAISGRTRGAGGPYNADGTNIYAYLTVPEDAKIGVCCHELGHLVVWLAGPVRHGLFQRRHRQLVLDGRRKLEWERRSAGAPSAWCKADQGWVTVQKQATNATLNMRT
jgi:immune inhibitor A